MTNTNVMPVQLEHANITVQDPDKMAEELCNLFGWRVRWAGQSTLGGRTVHVGNEHAYLSLYNSIEESDESAELSSYSRDNGLNHIGLVVDDLDAIEARVVGAGYKTYLHGNYEPGRRFYFSLTGGLELELVSYTKS